MLIYFIKVSLGEAAEIGIHIASTSLTFKITNEIRQVLGDDYLQAEILRTPSSSSFSVPAIYLYHFKPRSIAAVIRDLRSETVYNVRFFVVKDVNTVEKRIYFVNAFIKTGTACHYPF